MTSGRTEERVETLEEKIARVVKEDVTYALARAQQMANRTGAVRRQEDMREKQTELEDEIEKLEKQLETLEGEE